MVEIDSLEISIQNNIEKVNKNMDLLIQKMGTVAQGISAIGSNKGLEEFIKTAKTASESMGNVGKKVEQSVKPIEGQMQKIAKSFEQVGEPFKDLGKGFKVSGGIADIQKSIQKYENELERAKLKEQELSATGRTDTEGYRTAVARVIEYRNVIESLKEQLKDVKALEDTKVEIPVKNLSIEEFTARIRKQIEQSLSGLKIENPISIGSMSDEQFSVFKELKEEAEKARNSLSVADEELEEIGRTAENTGNIIRNLSRSFEYSASAMKTVFGEEYANIENFKKMAEKFNVKSGGQLGAALSGSFGNAEIKAEMLEEKFSGTIEAFKEELKEIDSIIEGGGQESESGTFYPVARLQRMLDSLKQMHPEALDLISSYEEEMNRLNEVITVGAQMQKYGKIDLTQFDQAKEKAQDFEAALNSLKNIQPKVNETNLTKLQNKLKAVEGQTEKLRYELEKGLRFGTISDKQFDNLTIKIRESENTAEALKKKIEEVGSGGVKERVENLSKSFAKVSSASKKLSKALSGVINSLKRFAKGVVSVFSRIGKLAKSMLLLGNYTKKSNGGFNLGLKTILKYGFGIRSLYILVNKLKKAVREGMENLIQYSERTNVSVSTLNSSLSQFKNASAAAFAPILNAIAPVLNQLIQLFIRATNAVNQFLSALTGSDTWIKAKYNYEDVADSISGAADAAKGALQPFDKLNNLTTQKNADGGISPDDMFETVPISDKIKDFAEKVKDILKKLFEPLKEAWDREGKFVMDSWKYALDEVWKLIKDIGRDFLTVWQQPATVDVLADILHIIGDIGLIVGHLARNFREAWNENQTGLHILENIRDILAVIIHNIRLAADFTVEWADKLNFSPILQAIERFTESLIPVADALSGVMMDFYTMVLLPLAKWTVEKGLPELLDVFTAFNEKVDWGRLRENLAEFWRHLEPFAETIGEGLIIFIERVSDAIANFINSEAFVNFLHAVEDWMDSVTPEDVADGFEALAKALVALKVAMVAFSGLSKIILIISTIINTFGKMGTAIAKVWGILKSFASGIKSILSVLSQGLQGINGVVLGLSNAFMMLNPGMLGELSLRFDNFIAGTWLDPNEWTGLPRIVVDAISDTLYAIVDDLVDFSTTIDLFESAAYFFNQAKKSFEEQDWSGLARNIIDGIAGGLLGAISFFTQPIQNIFETIWQGLCDVFGIHSPATTMVPVGQNILLGVIQGFNEKIGEFTTAIQTWFDSYVSPWFTKEKWINLYSSIKTTLIEVWNNVVAQWKNGISSWWNTNVLPWFTYEKWNGMLSKIPQSFINAFNKIKQIASNAMQEVYNKVSGIVGKISSVLSSISSAIINVTSGFSGISYKTPRTSNQSTSRIKGYKSGGFPEDGLFYKNSDEIVTQVAGRTQVLNSADTFEMIKQAAYAGFLQAMSNSGGVGVNVTFQVEGDPNGLFNVIQQEVQTKAKRQGSAPPAVFA